MSENHDNFITVMQGARGWFAVMMWWNDEEPDLSEGFWEPWNSSQWAFATKDEAIKDGKFWAKLEELEFKL